MTTCWWHRLWTTQVHTDRKTKNKKKHQLSNFDYTFEKLCRKETIRASHPGTGSPVFQKHPCKQRQTPSHLAQSKYMRAHGGDLPHHINSLQWKQKVGCRRNVDMNLCPLTWWILRLTAPLRFLVNCLYVFSFTVASSDRKKKRAKLK